MEVVDAEVLVRSDRGLPLLLSRKYGGGWFFYLTADVWNLPLVMDQFVACMERIAGALPVPVEADCHVEYAAGREADYLWVPNYGQRESCRIRLKREAEIVFGSGELEVLPGELCLKHARQVVLRLKKEAEK